MAWLSGAVWGAANGAAKLPSALLEELEARSQIETTAEALHAVIVELPGARERAPGIL